MTKALIAIGDKILKRGISASVNLVRREEWVDPFNDDAGKTTVIYAQTCVIIDGEIISIERKIGTRYWCPV